MRILSVILCLLFSINAYASDSRYDKYFIAAAKRNFGSQVNPAWLKAVAMAESGLKYNAKSYVGAQGLMQFMPSTFSSIAPEPWKSLGAMDPESAIMVGGIYLKQIWDKYPKAETYHRKAFSNAGYNSGPGNINKARAKCFSVSWCKSEEWDNPNVELFLVTLPQFQKETRDYVKRIREFETKIVIGGGVH